MDSSTLTETSSSSQNKNPLGIEAIIFDLDGVIVDTARYHFLAWKRLADELDIPFSEEDNEQLKGVSRVVSMERLLSMGDKPLPEEEKKQYMNQKNIWYREYIKQMTPNEILDGVLDFLDETAAADIKMAVGSSSKNTPLIMERIGIESYFGAIVDGNQITNSKPDPEVFLKAAQKLGVKPERCIVLEDAESGVEAANAAGMYSVGVGRSDILGEADVVIPSLSGQRLDDLLDRLASARKEKGNNRKVE